MYGFLILLPLTLISLLIGSLIASSMQLPITWRTSPMFFGRMHLLGRFGPNDPYGCRLRHMWPPMWCFASH